MAKSPRFDNAFLGEQLERRKKWNQKGVKAGHGGQFNIDAPLAEMKRSTKSVIPPAPPSVAPVVSTALIDTTDLPCWMIKVMESDREVALSATQKVDESIVPSPHKRRIGQGIKSEKERNNPQLKEHWLQVRIFFVLEKEHPDSYELAFAVPNGGFRTGRSANLMMYEGQKKGTPDICIPEPRGVYHGMFLEVKTEKGTLSKSQKSKIELYKRQGYYVVTGKGFDECMSHIRNYLALPVFDNKTTLAA